MKSQLNNVITVLRNRVNASRLIGRLTFVVALSLTASARAQSYSWSNVPIGGGGFVSGIITTKAQQNLMYARTDVGGAYRWEAGSKSWKPLLDWVSEGEMGYMGVESLAIDPKFPNNVYMLVGTSYFNSGKTAILRSTDKGNSFAVTDVTAQFKAHGNGIGRGTGERLAVDPNNGSVLFCGTRENGLFKSTNSGANWSRVTSLNVTTTSNGNGIDIVVFDPSTAASTSGNVTQTIIVGVSRSGSNLYRSNDGGQSFSAIAGAPTSLMPQRAVLSGDRNLYITYGNGAAPSGTSNEALDQGQIWKYNLANGSWTNVTPAGVTRAFGGISVDPSNPNRLVSSTTNNYSRQGNSWGDQIFLTVNGGSSWTNVVERGFQLDNNGVTWMNNAESIHWASSIEFDPFNSKRVHVISGNGLFTTEDIDATPCVWKFNVPGLEETVPLNMVSLPNGGPMISAVGDYDGFRSTDVYEYAPIHTPRMGTTNGLAYAWTNPNKVVRVGSSMYYSVDAGLNWTKTANLQGSQGNVSLSANGNTLLHTPGGTNSTYRSTDNGNTWTLVNGLSFEAYVVSDTVNSNKFYAYNPASGTMMASTDGGISFTSTGTLPTWGAKRVQTVPGFEGHLWVPLYGNGLARSTNSGQSFQTLGTVGACSAIGVGKAASGANYPTLFIWGTVNGVTGLFRSTNQGSSWTRINDDNHEWGGPGNGIVIGDMNRFGRVYMSTVGRGIVVGEPAGPIVNGVYKIVSRNSGKALDVDGARTDDGTNVQQWTYYGGSNQLWNLRYLDNDLYQIKSCASGKVLDVAGVSTQDGANVHIWSWVGGENQKWKLVPTSDGYYSVIANHSGKALDIYGASTSDGGNAVQWTATGSYNQQWSFQAP